MFFLPTSKTANLACLLRFCAVVIGVVLALAAFAPASAQGQALSVGNLVFADSNGNGFHDAGEGLSGVRVELWKQTGDPENPQLLQAFVASQANGAYLFQAVPAGEYVVTIPASEFAPGKPLNGHLSLPGAQVVGDDDTGEDGQDVLEPGTSGVSTMPFSLAVGTAPGGFVESGFQGNSDDSDDANVDLTIDLGFYHPVGLGNTVFADTNGNGRADTGEGIAGIVVQLFHAADNPQALSPLNDALTDADGHYFFGGLLPGLYKVHIPAWQFTAGGPLEGAVSVTGVGQSQDDDDVLDGGDNGLDDALPSVNGISSDQVVLAVGGAPTVDLGETGSASTDDDASDADYDLTIDFGFVFQANTMGVGNVVFLDLNGNGIFDMGEGVDGVVVQLFEQGQSIPVATQTTGLEGNYFFGSVTPGDYYLHIPKSEFAAGKPLFAGRSVIGVATGDDQMGEDGIDVPYPEETGVSSAVFTLALGTAPTSENGEMGAWSETDDFRDRNVDLTHDFGFTRSATSPVSVGNLVFRDITRNGHYDAGDVGISGVTVKLFHEGANVAIATPVATQVTAVDGTYLFSGLTPGRYFVHLPASEFASGKPLLGLLSLMGNGGDSQDDEATDENGIDSATPATTGISSVVFELSENAEPLETGFAATMDDDDDNNGDLTIDFGFAKDCPPLTISPGSLAQGTAGTPYSVTFTLLGDTGTVVWTLDSGTLPQGLVLSPTGSLSGTPIDSGTFEFGVRGTLDGECFATQTYALTLVPASNLGVGNTIFVDANGNGRFDVGEGISGVQIKLFNDGADVAVTPALQSTTSGAGGLYEFHMLPPGRFFVHVPASQFQVGQSLANKVSAPGAGKDAGLDDDVNEDGLDAASPEVTGVSSIVFELVANTEPTDSTGESGNHAADDDATDTEFDATIDLGFINSPQVSVGVGNLVFRDENNNHVFDAGEGVDGVTVQLFFSNDNPLTANPQRTTTTTNDGRYRFMGLAVGSYKVFIPASQFLQGGALYGCVSLPGNGFGGAADDDVDEDGIDSAVPSVSGIVTPDVALTLGSAPTGLTGETGADGASDNLADGNTDLTVDLGFVRDCHTLTVLPATMPSAQFSVGLSVQLEATGGVAPYAFVFAFGSLPQGVQLSSEGLISGTPTTHGSYEFGVQVIDDYGCVTTKTYTLEVIPPPLGVGNVVFFDRDGNGHADEGEGVDGVTVQLYLSSQTPGVDQPVTSAVTSGGGRYLIDNLNPGLYVLHVPAAMFATGAPLWQTRSVPGVLSSGDDDAGEDGQDAVNPSVTGITTELFALEPGLSPADTAESGLSGATDDVRDADIDLTRDIGVVDATELPATFANWQAAHPGAGGPTGNADGDGLSNVLEYALGGDPSTGAQSGPAAFVIQENQTTGQMSVQLRRRHGGQGDLTYTLQVLGNLGQSPAGWVATQLIPTIVNHGDGTETLTYGPLESDSALGGASLTGFVRVAVALDANHDNTAEATANSMVLGWQKRTLEVRNQTYAVPFVANEVFSGAVDSVNAASVSVGASLGSVNVTSLFAAGYEYYVEVIGGDAQGQRWEVDEAASSGATIALLTAHARSTSLTLPANLTGDLIALRPHWRVVDLFPPDDFHATTSPNTSDNLLFWDSATSSYTTLWLVSVGGARWLKVGGGSTVYDSMVVGPCDGLFIKPRVGIVNVGAIGQVRSWKVACPVKAGHNFIGNPYPQAQSPVQRVMTVAGGFSGNATVGASDRVLVWTADATAISGYDSYYLLKGPGIERWVKVGGGSADQSSTKIFGINTAVFLISQLGQPNWILQPTWTP